MTRHGRPRLLVAIVLIALVAGCRGTASSTDTRTDAAPTPGCPDMTWDAFEEHGLPIPDGITISRTTDGVEVANATATTWTARVRWWIALACPGWIEAIGPSGEPAAVTVAAGATVDVTVEDPRIDGGTSHRIALTLWGRPCGGSCQGQPDGFGFVEVAALSASP